MPDAPQKPVLAEYVVCPKCTEANQGRPVLVHKMQIMIEAAEFFGEEDKQTCPLGHLLPKTPTPAAS